MIDWSHENHMVQAIFGSAVRQSMSGFSGFDPLLPDEMSAKYGPYCQKCTSVLYHASTSWALNKTKCLDNLHTYRGPCDRSDDAGIMWHLPYLAQWLIVECAKWYDFMTCWHWCSHRVPKYSLCHMALMPLGHSYAPLYMYKLSKHLHMFVPWYD